MSRRRRPLAWPKRPVRWIEGDTLCISVPFTWTLPSVRAFLSRPVLWRKVRIGGPAVDLMPGYLAGLPGVTIGGDMPGVLQRVNPQATRSTLGCVNHCGFCAIGTGKVESGGFRELTDWPDLPVLCDNNLLAASPEHLDRVFDRLERWGWCDFNQGLDVRLLNEYHAERIARIPGSISRLAMDSMSLAPAWERAFRMLHDRGVAKARISAYVLIGFKTGPEEAWTRLTWLEKTIGIDPCPMWFHPLDALTYNGITAEQRALGWNEEEQRAVMGFFYKHRGERRYTARKPFRPTPANALRTAAVGTKAGCHSKPD